MPKVPSISPATGNPISSPSFIHTLDCNFVDNAGRTLLLRGVNLSGSSKAPVDQPSHILEGFWEDAENGGKSFSGRPLNVDDGSADVHLARLRGWGFNMLRFPVTWEALEHEAPGKYDYEFMDYTVRVLRKCKEYGFKVYIDPHQDVWSRFSGGSGAPFWTLAACGIDPRNLTATQSAIIHSEYPTPDSSDPGSLPAMVWSTNYGRLFSQTVFTMFFAGRSFAPKCILDGKNIQDYLQEHYIEAFGQLADQIRDAGDLLDECVIGWDSMNEPFEGFCSWKDLNANPTKQGSTLKKGSAPTPAQSFRLSMGTPQTVETWTFGAFGPSKSGNVTIDPKGAKMWADPGIEQDGVHPKWGWKRDSGWKLGTCVWAQHGVWDLETGHVLRPDYFWEEGVEFVKDYWLSHWRLFAARIRASHPESIMFVQPPVFAPPPSIDEAYPDGVGLNGRCAFSGHYYDGLTLITRHWNWFNADALGVIRGHYSSPMLAVKIGESAIRRSLQEQLGILKSDALTLGPYPTIIGEIGTPFDMDGKRSYGYGKDGEKGKGDYSRQERALDASLNAADGTNAINYTIWTYCPDSTHQWGDGWNMEDLSLWSADDVGVEWTGSVAYSDGETSSKQLRLNDADDSVSMFGMGRDDSQAALLRKNSLDRRRAASSALSLATLSLGHTESTFENDPDTQSQDLTQTLNLNPYIFLTAGARAYKAFSRPYPTKVIGKTKSVEFNITSTKFTLVIRVGGEDKPNQYLLEEKDNDGLGLATEIFVPLVHYAQEKLLPSTSASQSQIAPAPTPSLIVSRSDEGSNSSSTLTGPSNPISTLTANSSLPWLNLIDPTDMLDVEVSVSAGRWEVHGQTLKWWYDVPVSTSGSGDQEREYTIEIRRRGGAIKTMGLSAADGCGSWVDQLCPEDASCCVM